jgi:thiosulfate/3-mercaptopyruvate sulfurtransferase
MNPQTLIGVGDLRRLLGSRGLLIVDCRSDLANPATARRDYEAGHIPGAMFAELDTDLADLTKHGLGRHPLPDAARFVEALARWGWTPQSYVVACDGANGALSAARLWWLLRLIGHRHTAVLDGGFQAWRNAGFELSSQPPAPKTQESAPAVQFDAAQIVYTDELRQPGTRLLLLDARAAPRFRGEVESIDPVAGHVPGARNRPFTDNLEAAGTFKPARTLRDEFEALLGNHRSADVAHMCGSGVTACHNLLAMEHAGLAGSRIYAPSWSGWIADPARPVAHGPA